MIQAVEKIFTYTIAILVLGSCNDVKSKKHKVLVEIGRMLFYDQRLSINQTKSCSSCHQQEFAFTDGYKKSIGAYGDLHLRNSAPLFNLASKKFFTAADSTINTLTKQMEQPLFGKHPIEMGLSSDAHSVLKTISLSPSYKSAIRQAGWPENYILSWANVMQCLKLFELSIESKGSRYDQFLKGDVWALNPQEHIGRLLFFSSKTQCFQCHGGSNFSEPVFTSQESSTTYFYNTGLYNLDSLGSYPHTDQGLYLLTQQNKDRGRFRVPTLRNLAYTAPYYHDGSEERLEQVIANYIRGGRKISIGIYKGDGATNINKHPLIKPIAISSFEKKCLLNFLLTLTDSNIVKNKNYSNPFIDDETEIDNR